MSRVLVDLGLIIIGSIEFGMWHHDVNAGLFMLMVLILVIPVIDRLRQP